MSLKSKLSELHAAFSAALHNCNAELSIPAGDFAALSACIAEECRRRYDSGRQSGFAAGYDQGMAEGLEAGRIAGIEDGKTEAYHTFWDDIQGGGSRTDYSYAFGGIWDDDNFKPKYDLNVARGPYMFAFSKITDMVALLERQGVKLDFSYATTNSALNQAFYESSITRLGVVDLSGQGNCNYIFYCARKLVSIEKVIFSSTRTHENTKTMFQQCESLVDVEFEGVIKREMDLRWSTKLSRASIESLFAVLDTTVTGYTVTFSKTAVEAAFTEDEWAALCATRPNWVWEVV